MTDEPIIDGPSPYRAFLVNESDSVFDVRILECITDDGAMREAAGLEVECDCIEVWHGIRKLGTIRRRPLSSDLGPVEG